MALADLKNVLHIFGGSEVTEDQQNDLFKEVLLMTLARAAEALAQRNIFVWNGHNYAVEAAKLLGIYDSGGAVRVGPVHYNSENEISELLNAVDNILS